jgi:exonuclease III
MFAYTLSKRASGVANSAKLVQFPICVAFATTCHKFQGQTVPRHLKLIIDLRHIWGAAMAYVMLSRVMQLSQLFIIGEINEKKIYPDAAALEELKRMNDGSINNNPSNWNREDIKSLKISSLNCRSLRSKLEDMRKDFELCRSDIICLSETWLKPGEALDDLQVEGYLLHVNSIGSGKGIATYYRRGKFKPETDVKEADLQISKFTSELIDVVSVYRSKDCRLKFQDVFKNMLSKKKPSLIIGDMNICYQQHGRDKDIQYMEGNKFKQLVNGATHIMGGQIDHAYLNDHEHSFRSVDVDQYSPYYTSRDHDGLLITIIYE